MSGTGVNSPFCNFDGIFLRSLARCVPICKNFQSNGVKWRSYKLWTKCFYIIGIFFFLFYTGTRLRDWIWGQTIQTRFTRQVSQLRHGERHDQDVPVASLAWRPKRPLCAKRRGDHMKIILDLHLLFLFFSYSFVYKKISRQMCCFFIIIPSHLISLAHLWL